MKKFNVGDKVKIIQRKRTNSSGTQPGWDKPNGNVGEIGYVGRIEGGYCIYRTKYKEGYIGWFDDDDLELVSEEVSTTPYVKGKWYGCKDWRNKHDYVKLDYIYSDKTRIYFTECIDDTEYRQINDWWGIEKKELFEADMSIVSPLLPDGHPDKIVSEETAFVFPSKWCIKVDRNCQPEEVYKWRQCSWFDAGYINYTAEWTDDIQHNHTEITFEQFKQHVLKESPVVESPKEIDIKDIQEKAKKRFPIGCKFIPVGDTQTYTLIEDDCTYEICGEYIWAHDCHGHLYGNGKWATLVSLPEIKEEESIPEYVECVIKYGGAKVGIIYKTSDKKEASKLFSLTWEKVLIKFKNLGDQFIPSTKEAYEAQNVFSAEYIPQVGDYVVMERAGGWGYHPENNGCIAIVEKVSTRNVGYSSSSVTVSSIGGQVINAKRLDDVTFTNVPIIGHEKQLVFRKALPHEIPNGLPKTTVVTEWPSDPIVEQRINTPSIKKETFIEDVQSVNVMLRTKKKSIKF